MNSCFHCTMRHFRKGYDEPTWEPAESVQHLYLLVEELNQRLEGENEEDLEEEEEKKKSGAAAS